MWGKNNLSQALKLQKAVSHGQQDSHQVWS